MASLTHAFHCLNTLPRLSVNGRDGVVYRITNEIVFKAPFSFTNPTEGLLEIQTESMENIEREKEVFKTISPYMHLNIIDHILTVPEGIFMKFANEGNLESRISHIDKRPIQLQEGLNWIKGLINVELLLIQIGLIHGDLRPANILLHNGEVRLCDFAATVPINSQLIAQRYPRFSKPIDGDGLYMTADEVGEIFAIGTCIYTIIEGHEPYQNKTEGEVSDLFHSLIFPTTTNDSFGRVGSIVHRCWHGSYPKIQALHDDIMSACDELEVSQEAEHGDEQGVEQNLVKSREDLLAECQEFLAKAKCIN